MDYDFNFITSSIQLQPGFADLSSEEASQALVLPLRNMANLLSKGVADAPGGNWEVVSHDILRIDRHLVASFLIRRPKE